MQMFDLSMFSGQETENQEIKTNPIRPIRPELDRPFCGAVYGLDLKKINKNSNLKTIRPVSPIRPQKIRTTSKKTVFFLESMTAPERENFTECRLERMAIMQECAGLPEREAIARAEVICLAEWQRGRRQ